MTRDKLFRNEPLNLMSQVGQSGSNSYAVLAAHLAMQKFPGSPESKGARYPEGSTAEKRRQTYYEAYRRIKEAAEKAVSEPHRPGIPQYDPQQVLAKINTAVNDEIKRIRGVKSNDYMGSVTAPNRYDPIANALVKMVRATSPSYGRGASSVRAQLADFAAKMKERYGAPGIAYDHERKLRLDPLVLDKAAEHVKDMIEGHSLNKTFGTVGDKGAALRPADLYVKTAERKDGPSVSVKNSAEAIKNIANERV